MGPERAGPVAGVVLAAGGSTRMGSNKLLLELDGETVIRRAVGCAVAAGLDPVVVVLGSDRERLQQELSGVRYRAIFNSETERGINHSVRLGIEALPPTTCAAIVLLADMPFVTPQMLETLIQRYRGGTARLVTSRYGDVHAPPTLHDRSLFSEFLGPDGEGRGRDIVRRYRDEAAAVDWPVSVLCDIDVPDDYERARMHLSKG